MSSKTVSQIFGTCICYFLQDHIVRKGKKNRTAHEKKNWLLTNLLMRGIIIIIYRIPRQCFACERSDNILSANLVQGLLTNWNSKCMYNSPIFSVNKLKIIIWVAILAFKILHIDLPFNFVHFSSSISSTSAVSCNSIYM